MTDWSLQYRRDDGTFVILKNGLPYHVIKSDPLYAAVSAAADGVDLPPEPAPEPMPTPFPETISDRQFFQQLAVQGVITQDEALSAVKIGTIPAALAALVSALPAEQQFGAEMILSGATQFNRSHPLTAAIGQAYGWSSGQIDEFWREAAAL